MFTYIDLLKGSFKCILLAYFLGCNKFCPESQACFEIYTQLIYCPTVIIFLFQCLVVNMSESTLMITSNLNYVQS